MITPGSELSVARQAKLLGVSRSSVYYRPKPESQEELDLLASFENRVGNGVPEAAGQGRAQPGGAHP